MKRSDFKIGKDFVWGDRKWRCTDIGTRIILGIPLEHDEDLNWYSGPPYAVTERVFNENDIEACEPLRESTGPNLKLVKKAG